MIPVATWRGIALFLEEVVVRDCEPTQAGGDGIVYGAPPAARKNVLVEEPERLSKSHVDRSVSPPKRGVASSVPTRTTRTASPVLAGRRRGAV